MSSSPNSLGFREVLITKLIADSSCSLGGGQLRSAILRTYQPTYKRRRTRSESSPYNSLDHMTTFGRTWGVSLHSTRGTREAGRRPRLKDWQLFSKLVRCFVYKIMGMGSVSEANNMKAQKRSKSRVESKILK